MKIPVPKQLRVDISLSYSGPERMDAHGIKKCVVSVQLGADISMSCNGPERSMDVHGVKERVLDISISSDGQERMDAHHTSRNGDI